MHFLSLVFITLLQYIFTKKSKTFSSKDFINSEGTRDINIKDKIIKIQTELKIVNENNEPATYYRYIVSKNYSSYLIYIGFEMKTDDGYTKELSYQESESNDDYIIYDLQFNDFPMNTHEDRTIKIVEHYFGRLEFYPKKIFLKDDQNELYRDHLNIYSAYETKKQKVTIILPSEGTSLIRYTQRGSNKSKDKIIYDLREPIEAFRADSLYLHYMNNEPFMVMNHAKREYRISHWGNIAVNENYQLANEGALLDGEFSRIDYDDYGRTGGKNALRHLLATLPMKSNGLWYRDEIGNVSTSEASRQWDNVKLELHPRFPILGGWISNFDLGYNLPTKFHVKKNEGNNNEFMVNLTFGMPFDDILAKEYSVKVVLPEGADNIKVHLPVEGKVEILNVKEYGCLDLFGRNAVIIKMKNIYDRHKVNFQVFYSFSNFSLAFKPIIVVFYFLLIFSSLIVYFRANLSLSPKVADEKVKRD